MNADLVEKENFVKIVYPNVKTVMIRNLVTPVKILPDLYLLVYALMENMILSMMEKIVGLVTTLVLLVITPILV